MLTEQQCNLIESSLNEDAQVRKAAGYVHLAAGAMVQKGAKVPDGTKVNSRTIY